MVENLELLFRKNLYLPIILFIHSGKVFHEEILDLFQKNNKSPSGSTFRSKKEYLISKGIIIEKKDKNHIKSRTNIFYDLNYENLLDIMLTHFLGNYKFFKSGLKEERYDEYELAQIHKDLSIVLNQNSYESHKSRKRKEEKIDFAKRNNMLMNEILVEILKEYLTSTNKMLNKDLLGELKKKDEQLNKENKLNMVEYNKFIEENNLQKLSNDQKNEIFHEFHKFDSELNNQLNTWKKISKHSQITLIPKMGRNDKNKNEIMKSTMENLNMVDFTEGFFDFILSGKANKLLFKFVNEKTKKMGHTFIKKELTFEEFEDIGYENGDMKVLDEDKGVVLVREPHISEVILGSILVKFNEDIIEEFLKRNKINIFSKSAQYYS